MTRCAVDDAVDGTQQHWIPLVVKRYDDGGTGEIDWVRLARTPVINKVIEYVVIRLRHWGDRLGTSCSHTCYWHSHYVNKAFGRSLWVRLARTPVINKVITWLRRWGDRLGTSCWHTCYQQNYYVIKALRRSLGVRLSRTPVITKLITLLRRW